MDLFTHAQQYPKAPGYKANGPSRQAAETVKDASLIQGKVLDSLRENGPSTSWEMCDRLGMSIHSVRPRFTELKLQGLITDSGQRRPSPFGKTTTVWAATQTRRK